MAEKKENKTRLDEKYPRLSKKELQDEIYERTGFPVDTIRKIVGAYTDIISETIMAGVEVPIRGLGVLTFKELKPRNLRMNVKTLKHDIGDIIRVKGYRYPVLRLKQGLREEMRKKTEWDWDENES